MTFLNLPQASSLLGMIRREGLADGSGWYDLAALYAAEGKKAEAVTWLTSAVDHGLSISEDLGADPSLKPSHGDPAFEALVARTHAQSATNAKPGS